MQSNTGFFLVIVMATLSVLCCTVEGRPHDKRVHWWESDEWNKYFPKSPSNKESANRVSETDAVDDRVLKGVQDSQAAAAAVDVDVGVNAVHPQKGLVNPTEENRSGDKYEEYNKFVDDDDLKDYDDYEDKDEEDYEDEDEDEDFYSSEEDEQEEEEKDYKEIDEAKADKSASEKSQDNLEPIAVQKLQVKDTNEYDTGIVDEKVKTEVEKQQLVEQKESHKESSGNSYPDTQSHSVKKELLNPAYMNTKPDLKTSPNPPPPGLVDTKVAMVTPSGKKFVDVEKEKHLVQSKPLTTCERNEDCRVGRMCQSGICYCLPPSGCERHYKPVCGSDNILYPSHCELHRTACTRGQHIKIDHTGHCFRSQEQPEGEIQGKQQDVGPIIDKAEIDIDNDIPQSALKSTIINSGEIYDYPKGSPKRPQKEHKVSESVDKKVAVKTGVILVEGKGVEKKKCTPAEYESFKHGLLLYHCKKYQEPNCQTQVQEEREYLATLMFSFYDRDLDFFLIAKEVAMVENEENFHGLTSPCSIKDIIDYADLNPQDKRLSFSEFIAAFNGSTVVKNLLRGPEVVSTLATVGNGLELKCGVAGKNVIWRRFNKDIRDLNNDELSVFEDGSLFFSRVGVHHIGNYTCEDADNPIQLQVHRLRVQMTPIVRVSPLSQMTESLSTIVLRCHADGLPRPQIMWEINEMAIPEKPHHFVQTNENGTLTVQKADYLRDTGAYKCIAKNQAGKAEGVSSVFIQNPNNTHAYTNSHKSYGSFLAFHRNGYTVYEPQNCLLERHVYPDFGNFKFIPDNIDSPLRLCSNTGCRWGSMVNVKDFVYVSQPTMNRVVVVEIARKWNPIQVIDTDQSPMELRYVKHLDQVWVLCWNSNSENSLKTVVVIRDASKYIQHHAVHTQPVGNRFDLVQDLFLPPSNDLEHPFYFGYVTHNSQQGLFKLNLRTMKYVKAIDFSAYNCVPKSVVFVPIGGHVIVQCVTMATQETSQLVMDYLTDAVVFKKILPGKPYVSPDSNYVVTVDDFNGKLSVLTVSNEGTLESEFEVTLSCSISDVSFFSSPIHVGYDVVLTSADDEDVYFLSLNNGKIDKVKGSSLSGREWKPRPWKKTVIPGGLFNDNLIISLPGTVRIVNGKMHQIQCSFDGIDEAHVLAFSEN